ATRSPRAVSTPSLHYALPTWLRITCPKGASIDARTRSADLRAAGECGSVDFKTAAGDVAIDSATDALVKSASGDVHIDTVGGTRSEEHTSELQSRVDLVCRLR